MPGAQQVSQASGEPLAAMRPRSRPDGACTTRSASRATAHRLREAIVGLRSPPARSRTETRTRDLFDPFGTAFRGRKWPGFPALSETGYLAAGGISAKPSPSAQRSAGARRHRRCRGWRTLFLAPLGARAATRSTDAAASSVLTFQAPHDSRRQRCGRNCWQPNNPIGRGERTRRTQRTAPRRCVKTKDGREIRGVRRNEDTFSLQMIDTSGQLHLLDKRTLASVRSRTAR